MQSYYDYEALFEQLQCAMDEVLEKHGLNLYHPLAVVAALEVIASPLKFHAMQGTPLTRAFGKEGMGAYLKSHVARRVEVLKSPHSAIVNPLMDAIVAAIEARSPLPDEDLLRNTLRIYLEKPRLTHAGVPAALARNSSLDSAMMSAMDYLQEGSVIRRSDDGTGWVLMI